MIQPPWLNATQLKQALTLLLKMRVTTIRMMSGVEIGMTTRMMTMMTMITIMTKAGGIMCVVTDGDEPGSHSTLKLVLITAWLLDVFLTTTTLYIPFGPGAPGM